MLVAAPALSQAQIPTAGRILVATPALVDTNFTGTAVLMIQHSEEGSFGLFLNRPTWVDGGESFPELEAFDRSTRTLSFGGPVGITQLLALVTDPVDPDRTTEVLDDLFITTDIEMLAASQSEADRRLRIFAGHAVWAPEQLQEEIDDGYWRVVAGTAELALEADAGRLWESVMALNEAGLTAALTPPAD